MTLTGWTSFTKRRAVKERRGALPLPGKNKEVVKKVLFFRLLFKNKEEHNMQPLLSCLNSALKRCIDVKSLIFLNISSTSNSFRYYGPNHGRHRVGLEVDNSENSTKLDCASMVIRPRFHRGRYDLN